MLIGFLAGIPVVRAIAEVIAYPPLLDALQAPGADQHVGAIIGAALAGFLSLGGVRGPVLGQPFWLVLLAGSDIPRSRSLLRIFLLRALVVVLIAVGFAALLANVLINHGTASSAGATLPAGAAALGVMASVAWLAGQWLGERRAPQVASLMLAAVLISWALPPVMPWVPWGWFGLAWPVGAPPGWWALCLVGLLIVALGCLVPGLLGSLRIPALLQQARRWQTAQMAAHNADLAGAIATFRVVPRHGRSWHVIHGRHEVQRFLLRDALSAMRNPLRLLVATGAVVLGLCLVAVADVVMVAPALLAGLGAVLSFIALGALSDGLRHAAEAVSAPMLYGTSTQRLYLLHSLFPAVWALGFGLLAAVVGVVAGAPSHWLLVAPAMALFLVSLRVFDSAKGPLPPFLLSPVPSPAGDLSALGVLLWQQDAMLVAGVTVALAASVSSVGLTLFIITAALLGVLVATRHRMGRL